MSKYKVKYKFRATAEYKEDIVVAKTREEAVNKILKAQAPKGEVEFEEIIEQAE